MINNTSEIYETQSEIPSDVLKSPSLLFLYYRIEQILGIKTGSGALKKLNEYMEKKCKSSFLENPASYEALLSSREHIHAISKYLTVNETCFFRESAHFELLTSLLPGLIKQGRSLRVCSAAVSIGCEAYSLAMLFEHFKKNGFNFDYSIDAFDVNTEAIETAKEGRYTSNTIRSEAALYKHLLDTYLINENNEYIVREDIRGKINFFSHNIMQGLEKKYDVIFFRNALIYFTLRNRLCVINNLTEALNPNGILFLGISETASVNHPLLANQCAHNVFYFQKLSSLNAGKHVDFKRKIKPEKIEKSLKKTNITDSFYKLSELPVSCGEIADILKNEDGKENAHNVLDMIVNNITDTISGSSLAASSLYFLRIQDFNNANLVLNFLEKHNSCAFTCFLRAEYLLARGDVINAENLYQEASVKDKYFWPAFYKIAVISANGNITRFEYKINKTIESIGLSHNVSAFNYECFMGGFSADYFQRILEKKLKERKEVSNEYQEH